MTRRDERRPGGPDGDAPRDSAGDIDSESTGDSAGDIDSESTADSDLDGPPASDPRRIDLLAVTRTDVVDALEADARSDRDIVLRVTPPFSGRMRARLHDASVVDTDGHEAESAGSRPGDRSAPADGPPLHIPPERFVVDPPAYPTVDDTEDDLRAAPEPYTTERHRERHRAAVEAWREAVRGRLAESVTLPADGEPAASVAYLG